MNTKILIVKDGAGSPLFLTTVGAVQWISDPRQAHHFDTETDALNRASVELRGNLTGLDTVSLEEALKVTSAELEAFRAKVEQFCNESWKARGLTYAAGVRITIDTGAKKYARFIRAVVNHDGTPHGSGASAHLFVDLTNGNILKTATWKAPVTKNPRGNIRDANPLAGVTEYGVVYL